MEPIHNPNQDPDVHLQRLLADTDRPWWTSIREQLEELANFKKLPPLQTTSKPVAVKDIWGDYRYGKQASTATLVLHSLVVGLLIFISGKEFMKKVNPSLHDKIFMPVDVSPYIPTAPKNAGKMGGGGGGGDRSPEPASKGRLPKFDLVQLAPPMAVIRNENPKLAVEPSVLVPPDIKVPQVNMAQLGDPMGAIGPPSNGPGSGGGIGSGSGGGVGSGRGGGVGPGEGGGIGGGVFRVGGGVSAPQLVYRVEPEYTEAARKAKYQGTVVLYAVVDADGKVRDLKVARALGLGLDEKALDAVRQWKFRPGMKDGKAVSVAAQIEVTFRLL
jgi:TonB family protein